MFRELFVEPLLSQRRRILVVIASLIVLGLSESFFLINMRGFVKVLFHDPNTASVSLRDLLPESVTSHFPSWENFKIPAGDLALYVPLVILCAGLLKCIATYLYQLHQQALSLHLAKSFRDRLFSALLSLPYIEIKKRPAGEWMSLIMNDVMLLQTRFSDLMTALVKDTFLLLACYVTLLVVHWPSALILMAVSPLVAFGLGRSGKRIAYFTEAFQRELAKMAGAILDLRARFDFIRSQSGEKRELARFSALTRAYFEMMNRSLMIRAAFSPVLEFLGFLFFAAFVWAIGHGYWGQDFTPALLMQFFVALGLLFRPLKEIGEQLARFHETRGSLLQSLNMFRRMEALRAADDKKTGSPRVRGLLEQKSFHGWTLNHIKAGFNGEVRFEARGLKILPGKSIAIIGPSGAGKSTLIRLLAGLIEPMAWDGSLPWQEAIHHVSFVSQEPFLFRDALFENLVYGIKDHERPREGEVWSALAKVNIDEEVRLLPKGLQTELHAIGSNVSGGQLQRLVLARALLRHKDIWLLDEATSAIDSATEKDITQRLILASRAEKKALIAVTHRLSWLHLYDEVWFVEGGKLIYSGRHGDLLKESRYVSYCLAEGLNEDPL